MDSVLKKVKEKRELSGIDDSLVEDEIREVLRQNPKLNEFLERERSEGFKKIVKLAREKLHKAYGVFQGEDKGKVKLLLEKLKDADSEDRILDIHMEILNSVLSTRERVNFYEEIYRKIFAITGDPRSVLDIGCGFNPMSFPFMKLKKINYSAYDLNSMDIGVLNRYFEIMKITGLNGKAETLDSQTKFPEADVAFLFKVLDVLDKKGHKNSEEMIKKLKCKFIVASFSTRTISGKIMRHSYRGWMNRMLERLNYKYEMLEFENEVFYVIKK